MPALSIVAMLFQDTASLASDVHSLMVAEWIIAIFCLLVIVAVLGAAIAGYVAVKSVQKKIDAVTKTVQARATPLIGQGQDLLAKVQGIVGDLQPKIASVSGDVTHISGVVKEKVDEISVVISKVSADVTDTVHKVTNQVGETVDKVSNQVGETVVKVSGQVGETVTQVNSTVQDVNGKTKAQVARVNGIVSEALNATEQVSHSIQHGVRVPIDKIASWVFAARNGIEGLVAKTPFGHKAEPHRSAGVTPIRTTTVAPGGPPFVPTPKDAKRPM